MVPLATRLTAGLLILLVGSGLSFVQDTIIFEDPMDMQNDRPSRPAPRRPTGTTLADVPAQPSGPVRVPAFTANETLCFVQDKVLYPADGRCYKLREQGPCPADTDWLVLDKDEAVRPNGTLTPVCRPCPCCNKSLQVFWPEDGQCHKLMEKQTLCPFAGTVLRSDPFGEGECACSKSPPHARYEPEVLNNTHAASGVCYPLYRRGPCAKNHVLTASVLKGFGSVGHCTLDPCHQKNSRNPNATFAVYAGDGKCYRLGMQAPCASPEETFNLHPVTHRPQCNMPVNNIFKLPDRCQTDTSGDCQKLINLPEDDKTVFALELLQSAEKRKKRRSRNALEE